MKKSKKLVLAGLVLLAAIAGLLALTGCKTEVDTSSPQQEQTDDGNANSSGGGDIDNGEEKPSSGESNTDPKSCSHQPGADDGDCTTEVKCTVCGEVTTPAKESHTGGTATCVEGKVCEICGVEYDTTKNFNNHASTEFTYTNNGDGTHNKLYACCEVVHTAHEACLVGEATCTHGKLCDVCGFEYDTTKAPDNHASENYTYTDNGDGTHTKTHECGVVVGEPENHTIENHVCTACGAMEIVVSFNAGDYKWETGDTLYFCRISRNNQWEQYCFTATVAEDGTVTWTPDKTLYWDGTGGHRLIVSYPANTGLGWDDFEIKADQSDVEKLKKADCMNARWIGTPTTNVINFELKHRMAKVTVNYEVAEDITTAISKFEVYSNSWICCFRDDDGMSIITSAIQQLDVWVTPYYNGNQFTAFVSPDSYAADGNFIKITLDNGTVYEVKMNKAVTFEEGAEYTYKVVITADDAYAVGVDAQ